MVTLQDVKRANPKWFAPGQAEFFGDLRYFIRHDKSGDAYLIRETEAWTDMFDGIKKRHFCINPLDQDTLKIKSLVRGSDNLPRRFRDMEDVEEWLEEETDKEVSDGQL